MDPKILDHVTTFVLIKTAGRNCFHPKRPFRTPGVSQQCKALPAMENYYGEQAFTILRHR